jgi:hypothetical protein
VDGASASLPKKVVVQFKRSVSGYAFSMPLKLRDFDTGFSGHRGTCPAAKQLSEKFRIASRLERARLQPRRKS